jgi:hypothetical protein
VQLEEIQETLETVSAPTEDPRDVQDVAQTVVEAPAPRRSIRARHATNKLNLLITEERHVLLMENDEPMTYTEAMKGPDSDKWLEAVKSKLNSMHDNQVWNLVDPIEGVRPVDCKWIFMKKLDMDGNVHIYKARLVAKGLNIRFDEVVKGFGFIKNEEPCVYKRASGSALVFLVLYVDDILMIGNCIPMLEAIKTSLKRSFSMKDLGEAAYFLGIKIYRDRSKRLIGLSQDTYIDMILNRFNMQDSKKGFLPMSHGITLSMSQCATSPDEQKKMSVIPYASAIGSIMYAMLCTRSDVSFALSVTSRYQSDFGEDH